jgi:hypothetical protein
MLDRVLAFLSMLLLVLFLGVIVVFVKEIDLTVVLVLSVIVGIVDFWGQLHPKDEPANDGKP